MTVTKLAPDPLPYGSIERPVRQDPYSYIVGVHWGGESFAMATFGTGVVPSSIMTSDEPGPVDADTWNAATIPGITGTFYPDGFGPRGLAFAGGVWMIGGIAGFDNTNGRFFKKVFSSPDLANWTEVLSLPSNTDAITGLAGGPAAITSALTFVLAIGGIYDGAGRCTEGVASRLMTSTDNGVTWTTTFTADEHTFFVAVNFCNDAFFACAGDNSGSRGDDPTDGGSLWRSVDGVTWTQVSTIPGSLIADDGGPSSAFVLGVAYDEMSKTYAAVGTHPLQGTHIDPHRVFPDLYEFDEVMFGSSVDGINWTWDTFPGFGPPVNSSATIAGGSGLFVTGGQRYGTIDAGTIPPSGGFTQPYYAVAFAAPAGQDWTATDLDLPAITPPIFGNAQSFVGVAIGTGEPFVLGGVGNIPGGSGGGSKGPRRKFFISNDGMTWTESFTSDDNPSPGPTTSFGSQVTCAAIGP